MKHKSSEDLFNLLKQINNKFQGDENLSLDVALAMESVSVLIHKEKLPEATEILKSLTKHISEQSEHKIRFNQLCCSLIKKYLDHQSFSEADQLFSFLTSEGMKCNQMCVLMGEVYYKEGNFKKAENILKKMLTSDQDNLNPHFTLGNICFDLKKYSDSIDHFLKSIEASNTIENHGTIMDKIKTALDKLGPRHEFKQIKIAFIGNCTMEPVSQFIELECFKARVRPFLFFGGFNQYTQEILDKDSSFHKFNPDITVLSLDSYVEIPEIYNNFFDLSDSSRKELIKARIEFFRICVEQFLNKCNSNLLISTMVVPENLFLGVYDSKLSFGQKESILKINEAFAEISRRHPQKISLLDLDHLVSLTGKSAALSPKMRLLAHMPFHMNFYLVFAKNLMKYIKPFKGLTKKCIVFDLDNTLWGGIIGEDGLEGIKLGLDPPGNAFFEFQNVIKTLQKKGLLLAINSKNNWEDVKQVFNSHPYMVLKIDDFASVQVNWNDKVENLKTISEQLNIGLESLVFVDDNEAERFLVQQMLPSVLTVPMPKEPSLFVNTLLNLNELEVLNITPEDSGRKEFYRAEIKRKELKKEKTDLKSFLKSLEISVEIKRVDDFSLPRVAQLTQRTNQFNLTTKRYSENDIRSFKQSDDYCVYYLKSSDKFGDNGIVGVAITKHEPSKWEIDSFLLSCRVLGRNIEQVFLSYILQKAQAHNIESLYAEYKPTAKNKIVESFFPNNGFSVLKSDENSVRYIIKTMGIKVRFPDFIQLSLE